MDKKHDIVPPITVQIENVTLTWFESAAFFSLIVEVFLKDLEVQNALPLFFLFVKGKEFQEVPSSVNAEEIKFPIVIEVTPVNRGMFDLGQISQVARFNLQSKAALVFAYELKNALSEHQ